MDKKLDKLGYSNQLDEKLKFTYIIAAIGLMQVCLFLVLYIVIAPAPGLIVETLIIIGLYVIEGLLLKHKYYVMAKVLPIVTMSVQVSLLVYQSQWNLSQSK